MFGIVDITAGQCNLILHRHPLIEKIKNKHVQNSGHNCKCN